MKILNESMITRFMKLTLAFLAILAMSTALYAQGDAAKGEKIYNGNCASCHFPHKDMTGPALKGARERWIENSSEANFYAWVRNSSAVIASGDAYANDLYNTWNKTNMPAQAVTDEEIDHIFAYIEIYKDTAPPPPPVGGDVVGSNSGESSAAFWWILGGILLLVVGAVGGIRSQLQAIQKKQAGLPADNDTTMLQSFRRWAWKNRGPVGVVTLAVVVLTIAYGMIGLSQVGIYEDYKPDQPIAYSHKLHAGQLEIDCKYCHNAVNKSKHAQIPTVNVCMNCHSVVHEGAETGTEEIAKIHDAAGYDVATNSYTGKTKPVEWVKVHNLPDHVYFNHSQHVKVGGVDCKQCHGNMKKETVGRVMTTKDLNNVGITDNDEDENKIKFTKPTLTMGWCIECHRASNVDIANAPEGSYYNMIHQRLLKDKTTYQRYLEDDVVTVAELGGIECAKCHY